MRETEQLDLMDYFTSQGGSITVTSSKLQRCLCVLLYRLAAASPAAASAAGAAASFGGGGGKSLSEKSKITWHEIEKNS
jgi:hypothetical protein